MCTDFDQEYVHQHKLHEKELPFTCDGPNKLRMVLNKLELMIEDSPTGPDVRKIYSAYPCLTSDNYFFDDVIA